MPMAWSMGKRYGNPLLPIRNNTHIIEKRLMLSGKNDEHTMQCADVTGRHVSDVAYHTP